MKNYHFPVLLRAMPAHIPSLYTASSYLPWIFLSSILFSFYIEGRTMIPTIHEKLFGQNFRLFYGIFSYVFFLFLLFLFIFALPFSSICFCSYLFTPPWTFFLTLLVRWLWGKRCSRIEELSFMTYNGTNSSSFDFFPAYREKQLYGNS